MARTAGRQMMQALDELVAGALAEAGRAAVKVAAAMAADASNRPVVPYDGNGFVALEVIGPDRRLVNSLKRLGAGSSRVPGVWRVAGAWELVPGQLLSLRAPPCEAASHVLNDTLGEFGRFSVYEALD